MLTLPVSHWVWSQEKRETPLCTGTIREESRDEFWIYAQCDTCRFEVGISHKDRPSSSKTYDPDSRTQSQRDEAPF